MLGRLGFIMPTFSFPCPRFQRKIKQLWEKIPQSYQALTCFTCFTDFWSSYLQIIPQEQHQAGGKDQGETNHIERFNCTFRQCVPRLVRKTLSFSKRHLAHFRFIRHFLVAYSKSECRSP